MEEKKFVGLQALTPGSGSSFVFSHMNQADRSVHGYSMLRTSLNMDYYHDLYDLATDFGVEVEAHRKCSSTCREIKLGTGSIIVIPVERERG